MINISLLDNFCECKCGNRTTWNKKKKCFNKFIQGHTFKNKKRLDISIMMSGENNPMYGHTKDKYPEQYEKTSRTKIKRFASGELKVSDETRKKLSIANSSVNNPMFGRTKEVDPERFKKINKTLNDGRMKIAGKKHSKIMKEGYASGKIKHWTLTKPEAEVDRICKVAGEKCSKALKEGYASGKIKISSLIGRGKQGFRQDLGIYVRSSWEANFFRFLKYFRTKYEYEPKTFKLFNDNDELVYSYRPDGYLPEFNLWIEIKGYMTEINKIKIALFRKNYPELDLCIIDKGKYEYIQKNYSHLINNWE